VDTNNWELSLNHSESKYQVPDSRYQVLVVRSTGTTSYWIVVLASSTTVVPGRRSPEYYSEELLFSRPLCIIIILWFCDHDIMRPGVMFAFINTAALQPVKKPVAMDNCSRLQASSILKHVQHFFYIKGVSAYLP